MPVENVWIKAGRKAGNSTTLFLFKIKLWEKKWRRKSRKWVSCAELYFNWNKLGELEIQG